MYEISHMHFIRPHENDSQCEIDNDKKGGKRVKNIFKLQSTKKCWKNEFFEIRGEDF